MHITAGVRVEHVAALRASSADVRVVACGTHTDQARMPASA